MNDRPFDYWDFFIADAKKIDAPLYARLGEGIREDDDLKALAARARSGQPHGNMIMGAVHFLLLRGADHALRRHYRDLGGTPPEGEDPFPLFKDFVNVHRDAVTHLIETRVTNTNEVGRCAVLHPGFRTLAQETDQPLHLVEIGPSAGLNMIWDRYGVRYVKDGTLVRSISPEASLVMDCELRGDKIPHHGPSPLVASRVGLELNPVNLTDADDRDWLRALMWPDQVPRLHRLERAMDLFVDARPPILYGNALDLLPGVLARLPEDEEEPVCVYHTIAVYQFSTAMKQTLEDILTVAGLRRPVWRLAFEFDGKECVLSLINYYDGVRDEKILANAHPHGNWIEWLA